MAKLKSFTEGVQAFQRGDFALAVRRLAPLRGRKGLPGRLATYYSAKSHRAIGVEQLQAGRYSEAGRHFRQAVSLVGKSTDLAEYLQLVYARTGDHERCVAEAELVVKTRPDSDAARIGLAHAQWRGCRRPLAIMTLTESLRELGESFRLHLALAQLYAADEEFDAACRHFRRASELDCTSDRAFHQLGLAEAARGRTGPAVRAFQRACSLAPQKMQYAYHLCLAAEAASQAGEPVTVSIPQRSQRPEASAIGQLAEYAAAEPDFIEAFLSLPRTEADEELLEVVVSVLLTALADHDDYADLHHLAARALQRLGRTDQALAHGRRAVEINPGYVAALLHLAELEQEAGEGPAAVQRLEAVVRGGSDYPDVRVRLGEICRLAGRTDEARRHFRRALELNAGYERAREALAAIAA
jgi:tetratricopeptide (TPR) repeat protein